MSGVGKNITQSLNLYGVSGLLSLSAGPMSSLHQLAGSGTFLLGMGCATVGALLTPSKFEHDNNDISLKNQFWGAVTATSMGGVSLAAASFVGMKDIIFNAPISFTTMGAGFAMATGLTSFYGGLKAISIVKSYEGEPGKPNSLDLDH